MRVNDIIKQLHLTPLALADEGREVCGAYTGDLLSWVMGRAQPDQAWVTIMTNINVVAVASLLDLSVVIICDGSMPEQNVIDTALSKQVNILATSLSSYEICSRLASLGV